MVSLNAVVTVLYQGFVTSTGGNLQARNCRLNRNGNFCKGNQVGKIIAVAKVDARVSPLKESTVFSRNVCNRNLLCFGCFAAGQHVDGCFLFARCNIYN